MSERTYYVLCEDNCRFESMTKEQILSAITQAVEEGEIQDVDTGFVTTIKEQNANKALKFWVGTQAQYNAIETPEQDVMYLITDPQAEADVQAQIQSINAEIELLQEAVAEDVDTEDIADGAVTNAKTDFSAGFVPAGNIILTHNVHYFDSISALPAPGTAGRIAFVKVT